VSGVYPCGRAYRVSLPRHFAGRGASPNWRLTRAIAAAADCPHLWSLQQFSCRQRGTCWLRSPASGSTRWVKHLGFRRRRGASSSPGPLREERARNEGCFWPRLWVRGYARRRPVGFRVSRLWQRSADRCARSVSTIGQAWTTLRSDFCLFEDFQGIVHLDAEVPHGRLKLGVAKQQLHGAQDIWALRVRLQTGSWCADRILPLSHGSRAGCAYLLSSIWESIASCGVATLPVSRPRHLPRRPSGNPRRGDATHDPAASSVRDHAGDARGCAEVD